MSRIFKSHNVRVDENNRVNIKNLKDTPVNNVIVETHNIESKVEEQPKLYEAPSEDEANAISKQIIENASLEAKSIIDKAEEKAKEIIEDAEESGHKMSISIKNEAYKTGYDDGINKGYQEASAIREEAEVIKKEALEYRENLINKIEPEMIDLIIDIVNKLLSVEIKTNPKVISLLIKQGLSKSTLTEDISIHVSKDDYQSVLNSKDEIMASLDTMTDIKFIEDTTLKKSDCIIETGFGTIDCGLTTQYNELKKNLYYILGNR